MTNLLREHQVKDLQQERDSLTRAMNNPHIQDKGVVARQLRNANHRLQTLTPRPFEGSEVDSAAKREKKLREEMILGMPSKEEMRKAPPGAVGKHMEWEKRNKLKLQEWKNIRLRINSGSDDPDVANFERYRPDSSSLNMHNAQIQGKQYHGGSSSVVLSDDELQTLQEINPELRDQVPSMSPEERAEVKAKVSYKMSDENRAKARERMKAMHAKKKALKVDGQKDG